MAVELKNDPPTQLNWDKDKQYAVLGHLMTDDKFFLRTRGKINPKWFLDSYSTRILNMMIDFYNKWNRAPTLGEIKEYKEFRIEETVWYNNFTAHIAKCIYNRSLFPVDHLQEELSDWTKARIFHTAVAQSVPLFNAEKPQLAYSEMERAVKEIRETNFGKDVSVDFSDYHMLFDPSHSEYTGACGFGLKCMDKLIAPDSNDGALALGDETVLLAPSNQGKTSAMITIAMYNIRRFKPVLFIVHEGREDDLMRKIWCSLLNKSKSDLMKMYQVDDQRRLLEDAVGRYFKRFFAFLPLYRPGITVEEVVGIIKQKQEERKAIFGAGYSLVVDDYPAKLGTEQSKAGWQVRHIHEHVYDYMQRAALDEKFHLLTAIQSNRDGSKQNRWSKERLLSMEDASESWGPMTSAVNVITLNRDPIAAANHRLTYYLCKSRSGETGWAVVCRTNYANCVTHSDKLGARYYQSASTLANKIDDLLTLDGMTEQSEISKQQCLL